jgi:hypothetical protein
VISAESLGSLSSWSMSAVRTSCPVTRATPRRSAASRCQMSRARCWPGERSTVRLVRRLRVRPITKASVGAAAAEGVSGVTAACWLRDRSAPAPARLLSGLMCNNLLARGAGRQYVSRSVSVYPYLRGPSTASRMAGKRVTRCHWPPRARNDDTNPPLPGVGSPTGMARNSAVGHRYRLLRCRDPGKDMEYRNARNSFATNRPLNVRDKNGEFSTSGRTRVSDH